MKITIRPAETAEIDTLLDFEKGIVKAERPFDSTLREGEIHYYDLIELIQSPDAEVLIAEIDGEIIASGYAKILEAKPYLKHSKFAYLGFMYVKPTHRGKGINQLILNGLIAWAKSKNISEIRLEVYDENETAKRAYQKAGFQPNMLEMRREI